MISRALILKNKKILLIHRFKNGEGYYVLPGGHIEEKESEKEALIRELKEETNLDVKIDKNLWSLENPKDKSKHHFFLVTKFSGKLKFGGPELKRKSKKDTSNLEWHDLKEVPKINLVPEPPQRENY